MIMEFKVFIIPIGILLLSITQLSAKKVIPAPKVDLFKKVHLGTSIDRTVEDAVFFSLDKKELQRVHKQKLEQMRLQIPIEANENLEVTLKNVEILPQNFKASSSQRDSHNTLFYSPALYYRGTISGVKDAMVAINIYKEKVTGVLSLNGENYNIGPFKNADPSILVIYKESNLDLPNSFACSTEDPTELEIEIDRTVKSSGRNLKKVRIYVECDYFLYQANNSNINQTIDFATGLFNVVSTIYAVDNIQVELSEVKVWTSPDNYPNSSAREARDAFGRALNGRFNGDIAHLLSGYRVNGVVPNGGSANINTLCNKKEAVSYTNITTSYNSFPTYSWTAYAVTHEIGHNLGSPHTHSCLWPTGPIDNCWCPEGDCDLGPEPASSGGTIMSYCHLNPSWARDCQLSSANPGISLANGFGELPSALIRQRIANANCLGNTSSPSPSTPNNPSNPPNPNSTNTQHLKVSAQIQDETCGQADGAILLRTENGKAPIIYKWNNGSASKDLLNIPAGSYSCTVTDANNANVVIEKEVKGTDAVFAIAGFDKSIDCNNSIAVLGTSYNDTQLNYEWTTNGGYIEGDNKINSISVEEAGTYTLHVTHKETGCTASDNVIVTKDIKAPSIRLSASPLTCESATTSIAIHTSANISEYKWTGPNGFVSTDKNPEVGIAGMYQLEARGVNGCIQTRAIIVESQKRLPILRLVEDTISCDNPEVRLRAIAESGVDYLWMGPNGFVSVEKRPLIEVGGDYNLTVTNKHGCSSTKNIFIEEEKDAPQIEFDITHLNCNNAISIPKIINEARDSWVFEWSSPNGYTSSKASPVLSEPGVYSVTIMDELTGCATSKQIELLKFSEPVLSVLDYEDNICGEKEGNIQLEVASDYDFEIEWNNGSRGTHIKQLEAGIYSATLTDDFGCQAVIQQQIKGHDPIKLDNIIVEPIACYGDSTGKIEVEIHGGIEPYSLQWSNGEMGNIASNLVAGIHSIEVEDANGCLKTFQFGLGDPDSLSLDIKILEDDVLLDVQGGTPEYTYLWSNGNEESYASNLASGTYEIVVTDANDCSINQTLIIPDKPSVAPIENANPAAIYPNPTTDYLVINKALNSPSFYRLSIMDTNGKLVVNKYVRDSESIQEHIHTHDWQPGTYFMQLISQEGMVSEKIHVIRE